MQSPSLAAELERRASAGLKPCTVREIQSRLSALGYSLDRSADCSSTARWMAGDSAGESYPCTTTGVKQSDDGKSAFHFEARRDANFTELQRLRYAGELFAVVRGRIFEI